MTIFQASELTLLRLFIDKPDFERPNNLVIIGILSQFTSENPKRIDV
jgi:hypothetical protein